MVDRQGLNESGFTQFSDPQRPYNGAWGLVGRLFKKFFARDAEELKDEQYQDPITNRKVDAPKPLQGDAVQSKEVIKLASTLDKSKSVYPLVPQLEYDRKKRYKEYEDMDGYPEISSAFDIYADDCSQENIDGSKWDIVSDDDMIKDEVANLFDNNEQD